MQFFLALILEPDRDVDAVGEGDVLEVDVAAGVLFVRLERGQAGADVHEGDGLQNLFAGTGVAAIPEFEA